jgi:hypothetical protein
MQNLAYKTQQLPSYKTSSAVAVIDERKENKDITEHIKSRDTLLNKDDFPQVSRKLQIKTNNLTVDKSKLLPLDTNTNSPQS